MGSSSPLYPFTGTEHNGTEAFDDTLNPIPLGANTVRVGTPNFTLTDAGPLGGHIQADSSDSRPFYALSSVFQVGPPPPSLILSPSTLTVDEGSTAAYNVKLTTQPTADVTVNITAGGDVSVNPSPLNFSTTSWSTAQTVTVTAARDSDTIDDTQTVTHSAASGSAVEYIAAILPSIVVTVTENAGVTVSESAIAVTEGGATDTYTVVLDTAPSGDVTIAITETSADITVSATTLTFGTTNWSTAQIITVTAVDDSTTEAQETVTISHSVSATADTTNYPTSLTVDSVSVTITDNDAATAVPDAPTTLTAAPAPTTTPQVAFDLTWDRFSLRRRQRSHQAPVPVQDRHRRIRIVDGHPEQRPDRGQRHQLHRNRPHRQ